MISTQGRSWTLAEFAAPAAALCSDLSLFGQAPAAGLRVNERAVNPVFMYQLNAAHAGTMCTGTAYA
jgi:hypothetical protein